MNNLVKDYIFEMHTVDLNRLKNRGNIVYFITNNYVFDCDHCWSQSSKLRSNKDLTMHESFIFGEF